MRNAITFGRPPRPGLRSSIWTPRVVFFSAIGFVISMLVIMSITHLLRHDLKPVIWETTVAAVLAIIFFRRRKIALALNLFGWPLAMAGPIFLVKPSILGFVVTVSTALPFFSLIIWASKRYPHMKRGEIFERDPEPDPRAR